jgi:RNA polymerase sigma factor (sigma-70 family)
MVAAKPLEDIASEIVNAAQAGDEQAFTAIHRHYGNRIYTLIVRMVVRRAVADDLFQDTFVEALRSIGSYSHAGSFGGWLRTIAVNKTLSYLRTPWHRSTYWLDAALPNEAEAILEQDAEHADQNEVSTESHRQLVHALRQLAPLTRAVVWLYDVEGYTHPEIAQMLGRTTSFSKSQLSRAHQRLRELLTPTESRTEMPSCVTAIN